MLLPARAAVTALLTTLWATAAFAQSPSASNAASGPAPTYRSAFEGYQRFSEQPVTPWKASNDRVAQIGGWKAYAREAAASAPDHKKP